MFLSTCEKKCTCIFNYIIIFVSEIHKIKEHYTRRELQLLLSDNREQNQNATILFGNNSQTRLQSESDDIFQFSYAPPWNNSGKKGKTFYVSKSMVNTLGLAQQNYITTEEIPGNYSAKIYFVKL